MPFWDERVAAMAPRISRRAGRPVPRRHPDRALRPQPGLVRRGRGEQPVRRHPLRPGPRLHRDDRHRALGEPQPDATVPLAVRAGPRQRARHRRPGHRQPDRPDLVGGDDARLPRPGRPAPRPRATRTPTTRSSARSNTSASKGRGRGTWGAPRRPRRSAGRSRRRSEGRCKNRFMAANTKTFRWARFRVGPGLRRVVPPGVPLE